MNFDRIASTVDINKMQERTVAVLGGGYQMAKDLARCGIGGLILGDFDRVEASNPARQDLDMADLGRLKVEAVAREVQRINPEVEVTLETRDYCGLSQEEHDAVFGDADLIVYATDSFPAQARGNREILRLYKPAIWIGLYQQGRAGEIVFYVPGETLACYRCICSSRYRAFQQGRARISSAGGTIFDLHLVDAIAGQIAVGILTRGANNRMGKLIEQLGQRNLLQVKIDPEYRLNDKDIFQTYLGDNPANFSFNTVALGVEPEEDCPDCKLLPIARGFHPGSFHGC